MAVDEQAPETLLAQLLLPRGWWLAVAESCTGGLVGHLVTNVPGASRYFRGGVIAYHNGVKEALLGVPAEVLARHGAVSEATVRAMAQGVARLLHAQVGLAISGIAGPTGGTPEKPVGTVWMGLALPDRVLARRFHFQGDRVAIKTAAARHALLWLVQTLQAEALV